MILLDVGWFRSGGMIVKIIGYDWTDADVCVEIVGALEVESCYGCLESVLL